MTGFAAFTQRLSKGMNIVGGIVLILMMLLTVSDVILRIFGRPIMGAYELVSIAGALVVGFAIPRASWDDAHVYVDLIVTGLSKKTRAAFQASTKFLGIVLFFLLGINLFLKGNELLRAGEVSLTLHLPFYPAAYALAVCSFVECVVLLFQMLQTLQVGGQDE
jgi:TRAP-type C4-dicarboxylate transport system permease small subunit